MLDDVRAIFISAVPASSPADEHYGISARTTLPLTIFIDTRCHRGVGLKVRLEEVEAVINRYPRGLAGAVAKEKAQ